MRYRVQTHLQEPLKEVPMTEKKACRCFQLSDLYSCPRPFEMKQMWVDFSLGPPAAWGLTGVG